MVSFQLLAPLTPSSALVSFCSTNQNMLRNFLLIFVGASGFTISKLLPTPSFVVFEVLTICIALSSFLFVKRSLAPVKLFQAAFLLALVQIFWWIYVTIYAPKILQKKSAPEFALQENQFPMGGIFFLVAWGIDRLSVRATEQVRELKKEVSQLEKKLK